MKRYLVGLIAVLAIGYWFYSQWQDGRAATEKQIAREARQREVKQSLVEMTNRANAIADWPETLAANKKLRTTQIMTAELQKLWLSGRPILFVGNVQDVAINEDGTYRVTVVYNRVGNQPIMLHNELRVRLTCQESFAIQLMQTVKAAKYPSVWADTAVIANIERLDRVTEKGAEDNTVTVLSGIGKCVDAMQLTERLPMNLKP
jgi:hypothetical protein